MKIILATWNDVKFKWLSDGFSKTNLPIVQVNSKNIEDAEETGKTCEENALIKVRAVGPVIDSIIVGEDSGLFIDALNGFPGVKTVRWMDGTDDDRSIEILKKMDSVSKEKRSARFISAIALLYPDGNEKVFVGELEGSISIELLGESGKGYQRIFVLPDGKALAESGSTLIREDDHRHKAMSNAVNFILNTNSI
ncbi:MAG: non-canonical purine NTP pyrophosphatase [Melioribacteraceae bacterium]|nr:non-canonical purine NTP pyrophosphatase [Melioribacteraceae bacterium]